MSQVNTGRRLQICRANILFRRRDIAEALCEAGWRVETEDCLDKCTRCDHCSFGLVNGEYAFAPTPEAFLEAVTGCQRGRNRTRPSGNKTGRGGGSHATE